MSGSLVRAISSAVVSLMGIGFASMGNADVSKDLSNLTPLFSDAGIWTPTGASNSKGNAVAVANVFYSQIQLPNGRNGLALNGWSYDGWDNTTFYPVNAALLEQNTNGTLTVATKKYLPDPMTNGSGSVVIADFNGDGKPDIFFGAHNESPMVPKSSTAYLSNSQGAFDKSTLTDSVMAHDARLAYLGGVPTIFAAGWGGDPSPYYQFVNGKFLETITTDGTGNRDSAGYNYPMINGDSKAIADFGGNGELSIVSGDFQYGPGSPFNPIPRIAVYRLSDMTTIGNTGLPEAVLKPYFNDKPQYASVASYQGTGNSDVPRVWIDDFNHDGRTDIVASALMWSTQTGTSFAMLQMFQNSSASNSPLTFEDKTDILNKDYSVKTAEVDKSLQMLDTDNSGINTYFIGGSLGISNLADGSPDNSTQNNYILLNDGTGRLHVYMHDQFQLISDQIIAYLAPTLPTASYYFQPLGTQQRFIEYLTQDGRINLVAEVPFFQMTNGNWIWVHEFVNVPLQLYPAVDFTESITVSDRNNSRRMRTWAGNDTFHDTSASASPTTIDGGLGTNTSIYSGKYSDYAISRSTDGTVTVKGNGLSDSLKNIQKLTFKDVSVTLDAKPAVTNAQAFSYAAVTLPSLFSGTPSTGTYERFNYVYYPDSGNYLGIDATGGVWIIGAATNNALTFVGMLSRYSNDILAWVAKQPKS